MTFPLTVRPGARHRSETALRDTRPSCGNRFAVAGNLTQFADEAAVYDDLVVHLRKDRLR
jgi:hypothetical protein